MSVFALSGLLNAIVGAFLVFLALIRGARLSHLIFSLFSAFIFLWSIFYFLWQIEARAENALFYCRVLMMGAIPLPALFLHYSCVITEVQSRFRRLIKMVYGISVAFMIANLFGLIVAKVEPKGTFSFWPVPGPLLPIQLLFFMGTVSLFAYILKRGSREATGSHREQIRYVFVGSLFAFLGGLTNYFWWFNIPIDPWGNFAVFIGDAIIAYGFLRYRLMDFSLAVRNVITYAFFVLSVALPIALVVGWAGSVKWGVAGILATGIIAPLLFGRLKGDISKTIDRLPPFRKKFGHLLSISDKILTIKGGTNIEDLAWRLVSAIRDLYRAKSASVLIWQENECIYLIKAGFGLNVGELGMLSLPQESAIIINFSSNKTPLITDFVNERILTEKQLEVRADLGLLHASVCAPIFYKEKVWALLNIGEKETGEIFNDLDLANLKSLMTETEQQLQVILSGLDHSKMTALWAHDLIRPLGPKGSFGVIEKLLLDKSLSEKTRRDLEILNKDAHFLRKNLRHMVNPEICDHPQVKDVPAETILTNVKIRFAPSAKEKAILFDIFYPPTGKNIRCDQDLIEHRVFGNLIENALRFTPQEGRIEVGLQTKEADIIGWVKNTGPGISKQDLPRLFEPGTQLDPDNKGLAGLGLASVKNVIEAHEGRVWVESDQGKGATFYFSLKQNEPKLAVS